MFAGMFTVRKCTKSIVAFTEATSPSNEKESSSPLNQFRLIKMDYMVSYRLLWNALLAT